MNPNVGTLMEETQRYANLLRECGKHGDISNARSVHARIAATQQNTGSYLANLIVQMYGKCGSVRDARNVFDRIGNKDVFSWTIMITAYAQNGHCNEALSLFRQMNILPHEATFVGVLGVIAKLGSYKDAVEVHKQMSALCVNPSVTIRNTLIKMYGKCQSLRDARLVFDSMTHRTVVSWNAIIGACTENGKYTEALVLYKQMLARGFVPDEITLLPVIQSCTGTRDLIFGKEVHKLVTTQGLESNTVIGNILVNMYAKCGCIQEARTVFDKITRKTVVSINTMISGYAVNSRGQEAVDVYKKFIVCGTVDPSDVTYVMLLDACASIYSLEDGAFIHDEIVLRGFDGFVNVQNALVNMYGKCRSVENARSVFREIAVKDVISWTSMISVLMQNGQDRNAMVLFHEMEVEGVKPNNVTLAVVLDVLSSLGRVAEGRRVHDRITEIGMKVDMVLGTVLIGFYVECARDLVTARSVFEKTSPRNVVTWNLMITASAQTGDIEEALALYHEMDARPNEATFSGMLVQPRDIGEVERIHEEVRSHKLEASAVSGTAIVSAYGKLGRLREAREVFDGILVKDVVSWNSMISAYAHNGAGREALEVYYTMSLEGTKPSEATFVSVLLSCTEMNMTHYVSRTRSLCLSIFNSILSAGFENELSVANSLVTMFGKCGDIHLSRWIFDKIQRKNAGSWSSLITSYAQNWVVEESLHLFHCMFLEGMEPGEATFTSILHVCSHSGLLEQGFMWFLSIFRDFAKMPNCDHYHCMVDMLSRAGKLAEAEELVQNMPFQPDAGAYKTLLTFSNNKSVHAAEEILKLEPENSSSYVLFSHIAEDPPS